MKPLLNVQKASLHFGSLIALDNATLSVEPGTITGLIGPNGAGKTTLFNAVTGYARLTSGEVTLDGSRIEGLSAHAIAKRGMARTFQTSAGFPNLTVWENLMVAGCSRSSESLLGSIRGRRNWSDEEHTVDKAAEYQLRRLGLTDLRDRLLRDISIPDARLVEIARQLMMSPKLLLLDEPAAGFGPEKISLLTQVLRTLNEQGTTVLIIEHNIRFVVELASTVFVLARGQTIFGGAASDVTRDKEVQRNYLGGAHA